MLHEKPQVKWNSFTKSHESELDFVYWIFRCSVMYEYGNQVMLDKKKIWIQIFCATLNTFYLLSMKVIRDRIYESLFCMSDCKPKNDDSI